MNIFTDAVFLFVFLFVLFYFQMPNINSDNYLKHKIYLFAFVLIFSYILNLIKTVKKGCKIKATALLKEALKIGALIVIGYSLYTDFLQMSWSKDFFSKYNDCAAPYCSYLTAGVVITLFTTLIKSLEFIFSDTYDCTNN